MLKSKTSIGWRVIAKIIIIITQKLKGSNCALAGS